MTNEQLKDEFDKLKLEFNEQKIEFTKVLERIAQLEKDKTDNSGVFLEGTPDYVQDYVKTEKEGE